ncbi:MAG: endonuclease/exonuclease/phosphatase family protein [Anaerolineales bacterium]
MIATLQKDLRTHGRGWLLTALTVAFGVQLVRVLFLSFVGYLRDSVGVASLDLAPVALGIFALSFLAAAVNRFLGTRNALWVTAGGVALTRFAEQISQSANADLYLSAIGVALFLNFIPLATGIARAKGGEDSIHFGLGFLLGVSLDSAIHIAGHTLDLSHQPGILPGVIVAALAAAQLWALRGEAETAKETRDGSWLTALCLLAIGSWLFLQMMIFQNTALFASLTGYDLPIAGALLVVGNALGLWQAAQIVHPRRSWINVVLAGIFLLVPLIMVFRSPLPWIAALWLVLGQMFSFTFSMLMFQGTDAVKGNKRLLASTVMNGLGFIFFVLLVFIYYASYDIDFGLRSGALPPIAAVMAILLVTLSHLGKKDKLKDQARNYSPAMLAVLLLIAPLMLLPGWKTLTAEPAPSGTTSIRVMNYNLHDAVNTDGRVEPEALARIIEESGADIVGVQEISRGWLVWGGMDMLSWLSRRLDMPYIWGPTADAQWGNAIFSRYPIVSAENIPLPPDDVLLLRGHIVTEIDVDGTILTVIDTHFSEKQDQDDIRAFQASAILSTWNNRPLTIIMGDFNALPDSRAIELFLEAGLIDISREIGEQPTYTYSSFNPDHQIDYIFVTNDLGYSDFSIPKTQASDHLPLVVTITLP